MSPGSVALSFEVIGPPLSVRGRNMDLSFLKETLRTSVSTARGGAAQGREEVPARGGRKRTGRDYRK